jgi:hypothetical protein
MTVSQIPTLLPLDSWAAILGISPWEFAGFTFPAPKSNQCRSVFRQFQWQQQHLSREEVAQSIADAEQMIADELLYWPAPKYFVDVPVDYPRPARRDLYGYGGTPRGEPKSVQLPWHHVVTGGLFNRTLIGTIAATYITESDKDGDGVNETFTATITDSAIASITDANELGIYFVEDDRHGEDISEAWRVRPVKVTISGNTATFRGHRALLANPSKAYAVAPTDMDATVAANYVTSLDCYRTFTNTASADDQPYQGVAIWNNDPACSQNCTFSISPLCLGQFQNEQGRVTASFGPSCDWPFPTREPDRLQVNYLAGLALENGQMQREMAKCVTYLSTALLAHENCGCEESNRILAYWRARVIKFQDNSASATAYANSSNPFPATNGGVWAWSRVKNWRNVEAVGS